MKTIVIILLIWICTNQFLASRYVCDKKNKYFKWKNWLHAGYKEFSAVYLFKGKLFICFNDFRRGFYPFVIEPRDCAITILNIAFRIKLKTK